MKKTVLVIDDDRVFNALLVKNFQRMGLEPVSAASWREAEKLLTQHEPDLILLDFRLPDADCERLLPLLAAQYPVIVLTGFGTIRNAVSMIQLGASEYLTKPVDLAELELTVSRVLETAALRQTLEHYRKRVNQDQSALVGDSKEMRDVHSLIDAVAPTDVTVLIQGESGTGKEMAARAVHERSPRGDRALVIVDSCGLQEQLFESELFGHERGAFTGADQQKKGLIEEAAGGSLFLDEIGEIPPAIQAKLLRVIETGTFRRLGGTKTLRADVRFIVASNRDLLGMSKNGSFRSDLYYRLSSFIITLPPLRERREDIPALARHFLDSFRKTEAKELTPETLKRLLAYDWPGNVRELRNTVERGFILSRGARKILPDHLAFIPGLVSGNNDTTLQYGFEPTLEDIERDYFSKLLVKYGGNRQKAAAALGISERHAYRLIVKYQLSDL
ncbi:MAG: sigma-54 dependent transcriptional regulator [Azonexus sp.]|nr:sigma-54 dependent transcriptional regulator [Azonexus sp.]